MGKEAVLFAADFLQVLLLVRVSCTDLRERKIGKPETVGMLLLAWIRQEVPLQGLSGGLVCAGLAESVNLFFSGLQGIGGGDIRLIFIAGWMFGPDKGLYAVGAGCVLALLAVFLRRGTKRREVGKEEIAFGPSLAAGIGGMILYEAFFI